MTQSALIDLAEARAIAAGEHGDPFSVLGLHEIDGDLVLRCFRPGAETIEVLEEGSGKALVKLSPVEGVDSLFAAKVPRRRKRFSYRLRMTHGSDVWTETDPYAFGPVLGDMDEYLLGEGTHGRLWQALGAHVVTHEGVDGVHFAVWAPNARRVSVVADINGWDGRRHIMRRRGATGVHEIFIPNVGDGMAYKYEIIGNSGELVPLKADPVGFGSEHPPKTASVVRDLRGYEWKDNDWIDKRGDLQRFDKPISIYEVHLESWRRVPEDGNRALTYHELAQDLVNYAKDLGFSHIELTPISEYPFGGSWGYQPVGLLRPQAGLGRRMIFALLLKPAMRQIWD